MQIGNIRNENVEEVASKAEALKKGGKEILMCYSEAYGGESGA